MDESTPQPSENSRIRLWLGAAIFAVCLLLVGDIVMYSAYQTLSSRVEGQDHRIERLQKMLIDMIAANQNVEKIEKIEGQVENINVQMTDLTTTIKEQDAEEAKAEAELPKKKKKR